jgi:ATP-binding cassette subfamily B protein
MTERFNVARRAAGQAVRPAPTEAAEFGERAERVRDIGVRTAMFSRSSSSRCCWSRRWPRPSPTASAAGSRSRQLTAGTVVTLALLLTRLYGPLTALSNVRVDVMSALVSFERVFEVLDLPPMHRGEARTPRAPAGRRRVEFRDVHFRYPSADEVSLASLEDVARSTAAEREVLHGVDFTVEPGQMVALVGPSGAGKSTIAMLVSRLYDVDRGRGAVGGVDVRDLTLAVAARHDRRRHPGLPPVPRDDRGANLRYARPERDRGRDVGRAAAAPRSPTWSSRCPTGWTRSSASAATASPAARSSGSRSPGCCSRHPSIVILDEATATSTPSPRRPCSGPCPRR